MKALVLDQPGTPDTLHITQMPQPQPGEGEVRVKVQAAGLNPADYFSQIKSFGKAISVHDIALGEAYRSGDVKAQEDLARIGREFGTLVCSHQVNPLLQKIISLEDIPEALVRLSQRHVRGKIVALV